MPQYKVIGGFQIDGADQVVGSVIELVEEAAAEYIKDGMIELVPESSGDDEGSGENSAT